MSTNTTLNLKTKEQHLQINFHIKKKTLIESFLTYQKSLPVVDISRVTEYKAPVRNIECICGDDVYDKRDKTTQPRELLSDHTLIKYRATLEIMYEIFFNYHCQ